MRETKGSREGRGRREKRKNMGRKGREEKGKRK